MMKDWALLILGALFFGTEYCLWLASTGTGNSGITQAVRLVVQYHTYSGMFTTTKYILRVEITLKSLSALFQSIHHKSKTPGHT